MPAAVPIAVAAGGVIGGYLSGHEQSKGVTAAAGTQATAATQAQQIQADTAAKALAAQQEQQQYSRSQYADYLTRMQPYTATGQQAITRLSDVLGPSSIPSVRN